MASDTEPVRVKRERTVLAPAHEIWLSFTNDSGARSFETWWTFEGHKAFQSYCRRTAPGYHPDDDAGPGEL
ncbi:MAG: hypothetical protein ACYTEQ_25965 [Planctomycetota bacterium]|jgi:hypothetical protein